MSDDELIGNILHDLAGLMTSVQGLAAMLETQRDHPSAEEFYLMLSSEADKAANAVKDLQLVRALDDGDPVEDIQVTTVSELFLAIRESLSEDLRHGFAPPPPGLPNVSVDKDLLADLIARSYELASERNPSDEHHVHAAEADGKIEVTIDFGPPSEDLNIAEAPRSGRKGLRPLAIAARLLPRWNGALETRLGDDGMHITFRLAVAPGADAP